MIRLFVNLKRFEIPSSRGGICPLESPDEWIRGVIEDALGANLGARPALRLVFLLPESLLVPALRTLERHPAAERRGIEIGCQGVHREDVQAGGNFGAFTTLRPAAAIVSLGCRWTIVGHSEERRDKLGLLAAWRPETAGSEEALAAIDRVLNAEARCALSAGLGVLFCVGETAEERPRAEEVIRRQVTLALDGLAGIPESPPLVMAYEPVWAIGPGKTPPDAPTIAEACGWVKKAAAARLGYEPPVVYGGGLKEENTGAILAQSTVDGGLVALTRFTPPVGFEVAGLVRIADRGLEVRGRQAENRGGKG